MDFEWDEAKAERNLARHGMDFLDAVSVFLDPQRIETEDDRVDYGERRFTTIGMVEHMLLIVVFTNRGESTRIISARTAESHERRAYHESAR